MKRLAVVITLVMGPIPLGGCVGEYGTAGGNYGPTSYAYDGYYDDYYGPIYDGYWGDDGGFYYRSGEHDRRFKRGDQSHFARGGTPVGHFHPMQGTMTPGRGMHMPHFGGIGAHGGPGGRGHH